MSVPFYFSITGAPSSGKTTVLRELESLGYRFVPEAARAYIEGEQEKGHTIEEMRKEDANFQRKLFSLNLETERSLPRDELIFLDRAVPDSLTYYEVAGLDPEEIMSECCEFRYQMVLLFDCLPFFVNDGARREDERATRLLDKQLEKNYRSLGYDVIRVPYMSVKDRVNFILAKLKLASGTNLD